MARRILERAGDGSQKDRRKELVAAIHAPILEVEKREALERAKQAKEAGEKLLEAAPVAADISTESPNAGEIASESQNAAPVAAETASEPGGSGNLPGGSHGSEATEPSGNDGNEPT